MAALLQSYPQSSSTISMIQPRPSSASGILTTKSPNQISHPPSNSKLHVQRNSFNCINSSKSLSTYSAHPLVASIAPYAFTSTPNLNFSSHCTLSSRDDDVINTSSTNVNNNTSAYFDAFNYQSHYHPEISPSPQMVDSSIPSATQSVTKSLPSTSMSGHTRSLISSSSSRLNQNNLPGSTQHSTKPSPGRYRRAHTHSIDLSNVSETASAQLISSDLEPHTICSFKEFSLQMPQVSGFSLDSSKGKVDNSSDVNPQRYREKSSKNSLSQQNKNSLENYADYTKTCPSTNSSIRPCLSHRRDESIESKKSARSDSSMAKRRDNIKTVNEIVDHDYRTNGVTSYSVRSKSEMERTVEIPHRISSADAVKRTVMSSSLATPLPNDHDSLATKNPLAPASNNNSPATVRLTALKKKDGKKTKSSRLRRAFSFGSAAEFRNATSLSKVEDELRPSSKAKKDSDRNELDAEQNEIAQQQEASGLGSGIYTGQGNIFSGSTDNLSISSTASSASIMIRKMGKGMKRSTRSIVGLFRPKNFEGQPHDSSSHLASEAHVSIVNVEAERSNKFQNDISHISEKSRTASLKIRQTPENESNFLNSDRIASLSTENSSTRRSIIASEKERNEALSVVKKSILKSSEKTFSVISAHNFNLPNFQVPQIIATASETPSSTAPSTPNDDHQSHQRTESATYLNDDYFHPTMRLQGSPKSHPITPLSSGVKRNTTFSPRIQFHDTWPSGEYDRRGEIATCNRLTPMLAQQIKEELNTFKMEMEVHENSKIYTHFF